MLRKSLIAAMAVSAMAISAPAMAGSKKHHHTCYCGHIKCSSSSTSTSSSTSSSTSTSTSSSTGSTTGTSTSTSSGTQVPEPGMLGLLGAGLLGLGFATRRRRRTA